jgi:hypothetical protein
LDESICSIILCNISNGSICSKIYFLIYSNGLNHSSDMCWLVETGVDYYSSIATDVDYVIMLIVTIPLFKCVSLLNPNPNYFYFPATPVPAPRLPPRLHRHRLHDRHRVHHRHLTNRC